MPLIMDSLERVTQPGWVELLGWLGADFIAGAAIGILAALLGRWLYTLLTKSDKTNILLLKTRE